MKVESNSLVGERLWGVLDYRTVTLHSEEILKETKKTVILSSRGLGGFPYQYNSTILKSKGLYLSPTSVLEAYTIELGILLDTYKKKMGIIENKLSQAKELIRQHGV